MLQNINTVRLVCFQLIPAYSLSRNTIESAGLLSASNINKEYNLDLNYQLCEPKNKHLPFCRHLK